MEERSAVSMQDIILVKLGEIILKGLNRRSFEQKLMANMRRKIAPYGNFSVYCLQSTVYVEAKDEEADVGAAFEAPLTSIELSQYVGGELSEAFPDIKVEMHDPELTVFIEVRDKAAYVHSSPVKGAGGMPVGSNGKAVSLLSGGIDSPVSTYMIAKRGVKVIPVHFFSFPYTSEAAKEKVLELAHILEDYCGKLTVEIVPFTRIQEEIRDKCPEEYFTLIMRRFMMRIAERIADNYGAKAIVTGENLGQVASQNMEAMASTQSVISMPVLQPLIGMDKEEIIALARKLGTFDTSVLPYEDCCTVFTPRHPRTHPNIEDVEKAESALDVEALVEEALAGIEKAELF